MQSSTHIGKIVRQHAEAVENGKSASRKRKAKGSGASVFTTVPKHRAFVPMVTIWAGLVLALVTAVLPDQAIARASSLTGVYLPLIITRLILATAMGLAGALLGYIVSKALSNRARVIDGDGVLVSTFKSRDLQPINPAADLGSESFDAPIANEAEFVELQEDELEAEDDDREATLGELEKRGYDIEAPEEFEDEGARSKKSEWAFTRKHFKEALIDSCEGATCEAAPGWDASRDQVREPAPEPEPQETERGHVSVFIADAPPVQPVVPGSVECDTVEQPAPENLSEYATLTAAKAPPKPRSLDLADFAALSGRKGVWVEQQTSTEPEPFASIPQAGKAPAPTPSSALEKLRTTPAEDLSLVEMVERFAAALHDHQAQERKRIAEGQVARETALAEALKALSLFTEAGFDQGNQMRVSESQIGQTEGELRGALERLQQLRGAA